MDLLQPTDHTTHCPFKGDAAYWSVTVGDRGAENAVWSYAKPLDGAPSFDGYLALYHDRMDAWYEEDERIIAHPHDPYHRVDVLQSSRHVRVTFKGEVIAESQSPKMLFETGLAARYYLPPEDVRTEILTPVLAMSIQALPHTLQDLDRPSGTILRIEIEGESGGVWNLSCTNEGWSLCSGDTGNADATVEVDQVIAWRLATKGRSPIVVRRHIVIHGDRELGSAFLNLVAILSRRAPSASSGLIR